MGKPRIKAEQLKKKRPREKEVTFFANGDDGEEQEFSLLFRAIGSKDYDDLMAEHPPTGEQKKQGLNYNVSTFAPALLSHICVEPAMSEEEWGGIWGSSDWNRGELNRLFAEAVDICTTGFDVPFTLSG